jgi:hypothetical protein
MRLSITAGNSTDHTGQNLPTMVVDGNLMLVDLTGIQGQLWDAPTVAAVTWGPMISNGSVKESGRIFLKNGTSRTFGDRTLLTPYLKAFQARKAELLGETA